MRRWGRREPAGRGPYGSRSAGPRSCSRPALFCIVDTIAFSWICYDATRDRSALDEGRMSWVVRLADAGKRYVKYEDVPLLITRLRFRTRSRRGQLWAVRHVNLEAAQGQAIGVIG